MTQLVYSTQLLRRVRRQIGQQLHAARLAQRLTLRRLSRTSGIPEWRIDQYELGKNEIPLEDLLRLGCALGLPLNVIPGLTRDPSPIGCVFNQGLE